MTRSSTLLALITAAACMPKDDDDERVELLEDVEDSSPDTVGEEPVEDDPEDTDEPDGSPPHIEVAPALVDFGPVELGALTTATVTLSNTGGSNLHLGEVQLAESTAFEWSDLSAILIEPGAEASLTLEFSPPAGLPYSDMLTIASDDPSSPTVVVSMTGVGIAPTITLSPDAYDFGSVYIGCSSQADFTVANTGTADLVVGNIELNSGSDDLTLESDGDAGALPWTLAPGESRTLQVTYTPLDELADVAYLMVDSDDPYTPTVLSTLEGTGELYGEASDIFEQPITGATDTFALTGTPVEGLIEVRVDGTTTTVGWSYDSASNSVVFDAAYVPAPGATIELEYALAPTCP